MAVAPLSAGRHSIIAPSTLFVPGGRFVMGSEEGRPTSGRPTRRRCVPCAWAARP